MSVIYYNVDSSGNVTPTTLQNANPLDIVELLIVGGHRYTGHVYCCLNGESYCNALFGVPFMTVPGAYCVLESAPVNTYLVTTSDCDASSHSHGHGHGGVGTGGGSNGELHVGSSLGGYAHK